MNLDSWYESHFDDYGQPLESGWGPYLDAWQRTRLRGRLASGAALTLTEQAIIRSGQLGEDAAATLAARTGGAQQLPGEMIVAAGSGLFVALVLVAAAERARRRRRA